MTPLSGKYYSLPFLPATSRCLGREPLKSLSCAFGTLETHGHRQVCHTGRRALRTPPITTAANLGCAIVKDPLYSTLILDCEKPAEL